MLWPLFINNNKKVLYHKKLHVACVRHNLHDLDYIGISKGKRAIVDTENITLSRRWLVFKMAVNLFPFHSSNDNAD